MSEPMSKPVPAPDEFSLPYWEAAREHRLVMQHCASCGSTQYPPDPVCHCCRSDDLGWVQVEGRAVVRTFAVYTRSFMAGYDPPYVLALVNLSDHPGIRMMTNIVDADPADVTVGMDVEVTFEHRSEWAIPQFRPAAAR